LRLLLLCLLRLLVLLLVLWMQPVLPLASIEPHWKFDSLIGCL
jgi:hypothetical protein